MWRTRRGRKIWLRLGLKLPLPREASASDIQPVLRHLTLVQYCLKNFGFPVQGNRHLQCCFNAALPSLFLYIDEVSVYRCAMTDVLRKNDGQVQCKK